MAQKRLSQEETIELVYRTTNYLPIGTFNTKARGNIEGLFEITTQSCGLLEPRKGKIQITYKGMYIGDDLLEEFYWGAKPVVDAVKYSLKCAERNRNEALKKAREILGEK